MLFLKDILSSPDTIKNKYIFAEYYRYLETVKDKMPSNAKEFAMAEWHYDLTNHKCPHDSWLESVTVREIATGPRSEKRSIEIKIILLGANHNGYIEMTYKNVTHYLLNKPKNSENVAVSYGHGDWLIDEVRLSDTSSVIHDISFHGGSNWTIECDDLIYEWKEKLIR
jgi:hypothetical protein